MKRRVLSLIITLTLCLNLCPVWVLAADEDRGLCPHHSTHTDECGYVPPALEQECIHNHDDSCYTVETECIHEHTAECRPASEDDSEGDELVLCSHMCVEDSGCVTRELSCPHEHDAACGYAPENPGTPCAFVCQICPIEDLISRLPHSVSAYNSEQVQAQISEIYALYDALTDDEQRQVDLWPCISLGEQIDELGAALQNSNLDFTLKSDETFEAPHVVSGPALINTDGFTLYGTGSSTIQVVEGGDLELRGKVNAKATGVEVLSGGSLCITEPGTDIHSGSYALDIASGAKVQLSTGRYYGKITAIRTADGDFAALLAPGCAYFDESGNPILPADVAEARTLVIGQCAGHEGKRYEHNVGTTEHAWTCPACGIEETERCTFTFQDKDGTCALCGNTLTIVVDENDLTDLVYDGTIKPEDVDITVTLTDGSNKELVKGTDYRVEYEPRKDAGEIEVTVTGLTFNGTFTKIYLVNQDRPALEWDLSSKPVPVELDYDGDPVEAGDLPAVIINIKSDEDDLSGYLQYSYKKPGDSAYTDGLPTNAGTYEVIVSLPEMQNFEAAVSGPITLNIRKISPIATAPAAAKPVYNGTAQELVTAGALKDVAVKDGLEIKFATSENGSYSATIPNGTDAGEYDVWYTVEVTDNYLAVGPTKITGVEILRKSITPVVELSEYKYLYDGGVKEPKVTVKDEDHRTVLLDTEYQVTYRDNRNVGQATVEVSDKAGGNYDIKTVEVKFQITSRTQETLSITQKPNTITYGDQFTLGTSGGSGNGLVTWEIINVGGVTVAEVDKDSGQVTIIGDGSATVKATKSGEDPATGVVNYEDATAIWTFQAAKKNVTATVRAENKFYDGNENAKIHAVVEQGVLTGDVITITGLTGTFSDANAGTDKTVTVDVTGAKITGNNSEHYNVSYSSTTVKATIHKAIAKITTAPVAANLTYDGTAQTLIATGAVVAPVDVPVEYALSEDGSYSTDFPKGTQAGTYTVWYRVQETGNYTGLAPASIDVTINKKSVRPTIELSGNGLTVEPDGTYSYVYDGSAKEPVVTLKEADGTLIPAGEYTVGYSGNTNVGTATVTVTAKPDGNYSFENAPVTQTFQIQKEKAKITADPEAAGDPLTFNTRAQKLVTAGAGTGGTMVYRVGPDGDFEPVIPTKTDAGDYTVYYKVQGDANHSDSDVGSVVVTISPKTVKDPTIELFDGDNPLVSYTYDGSPKEPRPVVKDGSTVIDEAEYNIVYGDNIDAGTAIVNITAKPGGNYTVTGSETFVIEKADIVFNPLPSAAVITYDGKPHELLVPGTTSGGEVQYALDSQTSAYGPAIPTGTEARKYTVYYKVVGDKNHNDYEIKSVDVTIQRKPLTDITIELTPDSFEFDGKVKLPTVTVKFKEGKIETLVPITEYDWTCSDSAPTNQGTYTITITDAAGGNYDLTGVTPNTATFTIGKTEQAPLVIEGKTNSILYGDTFTLTTSGGSSSSAVVWSVAGTAATVDPTTGAVEITDVGEVTITATNPGDQNYLPVSDQWTFTAAPKPVMASVVVDDKVYDSTTDAVVASASITAINGDTVTIDPASITAAFDTPAVGTGKTVTLDTSKVRVTGDTAKYAISYPDTATAEITQATTTITTAPAKINPLTYSGQPQELVTAGETNVGFLVYSLDGIEFSTDIPTGTDAGTYTVYYKVDGTADYTGVAVNTTPISVTIDPKTITPKIEPSEFSFLYDGTKKEPELAVLDGKTVIDPDQYTVTWKNVNPMVTDGLLTIAGSYSATITNVANGNYSFTATATAEITAATQGALKITGKPEHVYYGDTVTTLEATGGTGNGTVTWSITAGEASAEIVEATGVLTVKGMGSVTVTATRTVPNYAPATDTYTFTVEPKPVVAVVTITAKDYDGTPDATVASASIPTINGDTVTIDPASITAVFDTPAVGTGKTVTLDTSTAQVSGADAGKYTISYPAAVQGDVNPRTVNVTVTLSGNDLKQETNGDYYYTYDGTEKTPNVTVTADDDNAVLAASDYSVNIADNKNVGSATVTVTAKEGGNYTFADAEVKFAIKKASAELTKAPAAKNLTYTGQAQDLVDVGTATGGTVVYSDTDKDDPDSYSEAIPKGTDAGTYTVYYMVKGDANHADIAPGQVSVTIEPNEITPAITLSGDGLTETNGVYSYEYDGTAKAPSVTVKDGANTIDASEYSVSYRDNTNAGTATVTVSDNNGGNYIVNGTATFEITKIAPTFTAPVGITGLQYSGAAQELVTAGVCGEGTVVYSVNGGNYSSAIPAGTAVDTYTIDYKVLGDANHSDTAPVRLTVSIGKNEVKTPGISLSSNEFKYTGSQQKPVITVYDDSGRLIPEREYTVTITGTKGSNMVDVDTYTVTITTPPASNYDMTNDGTVNVRTFKIVPADQESISITGTQAQVRYGDTIQLGVTGGTGVGTVAWNVEAKDGSAVSSTISTTGLLTVKEVGGPYIVTVTRTKPNYGTVSATWEFSAGKKPVTAEVTVAPKTFDGTTDVDAAAITAVVSASDQVSGDSITISGLKGTYDSASVGTDKTVTLNSNNVTITGTNWEKYDITYPATATASILSVAATVDTHPSAVSPLTYDASQAQELVTAGDATGGTMVYSLDGTNYMPSIPKAKDAGTYTVYFKAQGDSNHTDSEAKSVEVTIDKQTVTPRIELTPPSAQYDGNVKQPKVTVRDTANNVIPESEYKATYVSDSGENWKDQGTYKVKVENITGGNYVVAETTADFTISATAQNPLEIVNKPGLVHYGDTFTLSAVGGSGNSAVIWSSSDDTIAHIDANGFVTIKGTGSATITATKPGGGNYDEVTATYPLNALKKPVTPIVAADDKVYDGNATATLHVTWEKGALVGDDEIKIETLTGTFADDQVGTDKTVTFTCTFVSDTVSAKYDITLPPSPTASILKANATAPTLTANNREYDGTTQDLVTGGDANTLYSGSRDGVYTATVPAEVNAGTYTVWYKEKGGANHNDSEPQTIQVTISQKTLTADATNTTLSGSDLRTDTSATPIVYYYVYDGADKRPTVTIMDGAAVVPSSEYTVSYSDNKNVGSNATATIANSEGGNYIVSGSVTFEIRKGGAQLVTSPQAKDLTYTGQPQQLVTVGNAEGGHIEYALGSGAYDRAIPTETNAGSYVVHYKVVGDGNHADGEEGSVTVTIKPMQVVSPKVTVSGTYTFDGTAQEPGTANIKVEDGTTLIPTTEYTLSYRDNVSAGTATVIVTNANGGNYIVNGTGTFEIAKGAASVATAPTGLTNLPYNGTEQALVQAGTASDGTMVYSLSEKGEYSLTIPTGKAVDTYTIWYKAQGDSNHNDSVPASVTASIIPNTVTTPTVQVTPPSVTFNGEKQEPTVTVKDDKGFVIDGREYTVAYVDENGNSDLTQVGTYKLAITSRGSNYDFSTAVITAEFKITPAGQTPLTITDTRERVYYGDTFPLGTTGGSGTVTWTVSDGAIANMTNGLLEVTGVGSVTVTATSSKPGYTDQTATWSFYAEKKPVTAVVTAAAKLYDGNTDATVTAALQNSDLVGSDSIKIKLAGSFEDSNAGTDKKVNIDSTNPDFTGSTGNYQNYAITYPATATASIRKADVDATKVTAPTAAGGLEYTGLAQSLVDTEGSSPEGTMEYSLDGKTYSASLPTGTGTGDYEVWYRVKGDSNHNDTAGTKLGTVTIDPQEVTDPIIEFNPDSASYDGVVHKPKVIVKDKNNRVIPESEYTVSYGTTDWKTAGEHEVTVTDSADGNYQITTKTAKFTILAMGQSALSIVDKPGRVRYGDTFTLSTLGGSGTGAIKWESSNLNVATINQNGFVEVLTSGATTITATKLADGNYGEVSVTWSFSAEKRTVTPIVTARDKEFDGTDGANLDITWQPGDLLNGDTITLSLTGKFSDANAGTNKTVTVTGTLPADDRYDIKLPPFPTASITPKPASVSGATPTELEYNGSAQTLVTGVTAADGTLAYSRDGSYYTLIPPEGTDAGTYSVWYKAQASGNYKDSPAVRVDVTISPKTVTNPEIVLSSPTFEYDGTEKRPTVTVKDGSVVIPPSEYTVSYSNNVQVGTNATVTITDNPRGNYIVSGSKTFTIKAGTPAVTVDPEPRSLTYDGREKTLVTRGTAVNGHMEYSFDEYDDYSTALPKGTDAGIYEVWYKAVGTDGTETIPELVIAEILPRPVPATITVNLASDPLLYTGSPLKPPVTVVVENKTLTNGVDYTVTYSNNTNVGTATVSVQSVSGGNYQFSGTATFEIAKSKAVFAVEPKAKENLFYTGEDQELFEAGLSLDGIVLYSQDTVTYLTSIPKGNQVGNYTFFAKVRGDSKHEDSDPIIIRAAIAKNEVANPNVELSATSFPYTGSSQKPAVTVSDDEGNVIAASEYRVTYTGDTVNPGTYTLTITSRDKNYSFDPIDCDITILPAGQTQLTITGKPNAVYYGDTLHLGATGGSGDGAVTWTAAGPVTGSDGQYKIDKSGSVTITVTKAASGSFAASTDTWTFFAQPKPITAIVTAASKPYDGKLDAQLTVTLSGLVAGDSVDTVTASGYFADASVGDNKTVTVQLNVPEAVSEKYAITGPDTTTASITPAAAKVTEAPKPAQLLTYNGSPQTLLADGGTAEGGNIAYSVNGGASYSFELPTGTEAKSYTVWYKVVASDKNHEDSAPVRMAPVTIAANTDTPTVLCTPKSLQYDGKEKTPTVVVRDSAQRVIPDSEYTVTFAPTPMIAVGTYTVTVTDKTGGNYEFTNPVEGSFEIVASGQAPLSIVTDKPTDIFYGDSLRLTALGGSGSGAIQWSVDNAGVAEIASTNGNNCVVTVKGTGGFTVEAYRAGVGGYGDSNTDSVHFIVHPKPVTPVVTAADKPYDGGVTATLTAACKSGDLVTGDTITFTVTGEFATADAGTNKQVKVLTHTAAGVNADKYTFEWPETTTAAINRVDTKMDPANKPAAANLTYTGNPQTLLANGGKTVGDIGTIEYSLSQNGGYSEDIPTGTTAGRYTVWYKVADSVNYMGIPATSIEVEIKKADPKINTSPTASGTAGQSLSDIRLEGGAINGTVPGRFTWKDGAIKPPVGTTQQYVVFTPDDTANYNVVEFQIDVTIASSTPSGGGSSSGSTTTSSTPTKTTVQNGTASTVVSASDGSKLVRDAAANQSQSIVIKPEITSDVTKSQVSIPASTVSQIKRETNAALTVSAPIADVTIPNGALDTLSQGGGTLNVVTEQVEQRVVLTLTAGGKAVENVPGGVTLAVPAADAGPGTVAVLVHEDGTRETLRKSIVEDGKVNIPLSGSATVEIVDNSKTFTDVPSTNWAADAVAFASAHELFSGTSETTFSPDRAISRGMLATVLYSLEGCPAQDVESKFSDVSGETWYAGGIAWATENGIANGYGNGKFGPNDSVTREQFVLMLWKYAGSPKASDQVLDFTDSNQVSGYALEALCWAVENGILSGYTNGRLAPGGTATRAQAAQMLKNFMESN